MAARSLRRVFDSIATVSVVFDFYRYVRTAWWRYRGYRQINEETVNSRKTGCTLLKFVRYWTSHAVSTRAKQCSYGSNFRRVSLTLKTITEVRKEHWLTWPFKLPLSSIFNTASFYTNRSSSGFFTLSAMASDTYVTFLVVSIPVRGAVPASVQSQRNWTGSSVTGDASTPGPDTFTLLASNGGPARTRNGLLGTCLSAYFTLTVYGPKGNALKTLASQVMSIHSVYNQVESIENHTGLGWRKRGMKTGSGGKVGGGGGLFQSELVLYFINRLQKTVLKSKIFLINLACKEHVMGT